MWTYLDEALSFIRRVTNSQDGDDAAVLASVFPSPKYVSVRRLNVVARAVSWSKAVQTSEWYAGDPDRRQNPATFNREEIHNLVLLTEQLQARADSWFARYGIQPFRVVYEELVEDMDGLTRRVLQYMDLSPPKDAIVPTLRVQGDAINRDWARRYRERR
jgi:LPS sulfotransferase NodH